MNLRLELRQSPVGTDPPCACFLPGSEVAHWLDLCASAELAEMETQLFIIPRSNADRAPAGLLVIPPSGHSIPSVPGAMLCRRVADRLYLPVDGNLFPPVTDGEVRDLCTMRVTFFHPVLGLSGFDTALRIRDLLEMPEERNTNWNFAKPGPVPLPKLTGIILATPPSMPDVFGAASEEIGSDPITDLPPSPDEPSGTSFANRQRQIERLVARGIAGLTRHVPHTGETRTWLNDLEDWAQRKLKGIQENLERVRDKELHRLLHMLKSDPDNGLRHAIPFNNFAHRGTAPPGGRLGQHSMNFDPSHLGGGPADFWHVPSELREQLIQHYRELANREMQLGRHRRAAYIFAELLGDLVSAASALKAGGLYREAALLYEEQLGNALEAARCLAEGGLLQEAIPRFEKLNRWLDVADLYDRLGNTEAATSAVRRVVQQHLEQNDFLSAATLLEKRLHLPDEAIEVLHSAWPASRQAAGSVEALFGILGRLGRHDETQLRLARLRTEPLPQKLVLPSINALGSTARSYPDDIVRHTAAELSRVLIAGQLQRGLLPDEQLSNLLNALKQLAPEDRLLTRDANRFLAEHRLGPAETRRPSIPPASTGRQPIVLLKFELPRQIEWIRLRTEAQWFFAAGITPKRLTLLRGLWQGDFQSLSWDCNGYALRESLLIQPTQDHGAYIMLGAYTESAFPEKTFPAADLFFNQVCIAGTLPWMSKNQFEFSIGRDNVFSAQLAAGRAVISCYQKTGTLLRTVDVTHDLLSEADRSSATRLCVQALPQGFAIALGNRLVVSQGDSALRSIDLPGQAVRMTSAPPHTRPALVISLEHGAVLHWLGSADYVELDRDCAAPQVTFIPGGPLILLSGLQLILLEVDTRGVHQVTRMDLPKPAPIAVSATDQPNRFALLQPNGQMTLYHAPSQ